MYVQVLTAVDGKALLMRVVPFCRVRVGCCVVEVRGCCVGDDPKANEVLVMDKIRWPIL